LQVTRYPVTCGLLFAAPSVRFWERSGSGSCDRLRIAEPQTGPQVTGRQGVTVRVLGLHVKGGVLNYGLLEGESSDRDSLTPVDEPRRLDVDCGLVGARQLVDLADRFEQDLRSTAAEHVALLATRKHAQWKYKEAWDRTSRITIVMLACERLGIPFRELTTQAVGKAVGTPAADVAHVALSRVGLTAAPKYWTTGRAEAFAAAASVLA